MIAQVKIAKALIKQQGCKMTDTYMRLANGKWTSPLFKLFNLPRPMPLQRDDKNADSSMTLLIGAAKDTGLFTHLTPMLYAHSIRYPSTTDIFPNLNAFFNQSQLDALPISLQADTTKFNGIIFDATEITCSDELKCLHEFFKPFVKRLKPCARIVIITRDSTTLSNVSYATAQRAIEGFTRSFAKEIGRNGSTCQLLQLTAGAESQLLAPLAFILSKRSAYISGQSLLINQSNYHPPITALPLQGKTALVTGASRGIGKSIAETLTREGAHVICLDIPQQQEALAQVASSLSGQALCLDITAGDAPQILGDLFSSSDNDKKGVDIIVHNAGVTMDKTLAKMSDFQWQKLMQINLTALEKINSHLLQHDLINQHGRIICVSSMSGIAGNFGQTNYATSKAAIIGYVKSMSASLTEKDITINAVAPGFIETQMTQAMPFMTRESGRRMNSLQQGGLPIDVAEAITFFALPQSAGVTGNTLRVCGQSLIGA